MVARFRAAYPKSNIPDMLVGDEFFRQNKVPEAIAAFNAARAKQFDRTAATRLSATYQAIGQPQNAINVLNAYGKANPSDAVVQAAVAELQIGMRQYKPAIATYEAMLPKGGDRAPAVLNNLAWAYQQVGDKRAYPTALKALKLAPGSGEILDTVGTILLSMPQEKENAQKYLEQAVRASPRDPNIRVHLAQARVKNNRPKEALAELAIALKAPRFDSRAQALAMQKQLGGR
jgi:predicted Zn-dependent protease